SPIYISIIFLIQIIACQAPAIPVYIGDDPSALAGFLMPVHLLAGFFGMLNSAAIDLQQKPSWSEFSGSQHVCLQGEATSKKTTIASVMASPGLRLRQLMTETAANGRDLLRSVSCACKCCYLNVEEPIISAMRMLQLHPDVLVAEGKADIAFFESEDG
ncbi:unnamed protein product, partial [Protopolystoma xenopodis]